MTGSRVKILLLALALPFFAARAEDGGSYAGYTPYSVYGIGELMMPGTAYNKTMGGVGIASRNTRYINVLNPAAVTARDSLAFMSDFSIYETNKILRQGDMVSANNLFNINNFILSFPLFYTKIADASMMLGIRPYSATGYSYGYYDTNPVSIATVGNIAHSYSGLGSMYQAFATVGVSLFDKVSVGAELTHYFGNIKKTYTETITDAAAIGITKVNEMQLNANSAKFGLQFEQPLGDKLRVGLGAVYGLDARLGGRLINTVTGGTENADTVQLGGTQKLFLAGDAGVGISVSYGNKLRAEVDFTRSDWTNCGFSGATGLAVNGTGGPIFKSGVSQSLRAGVEFIPNPNDIRYYYKLIAYRAGVYYTKEYFSVSGNEIYSRGITLGATLPVFRWSNGLTIGMDIGQRGSLKNNMVRETYVGFSLGVNLYDIWFQQPRYE